MRIRKHFEYTALENQFLSVKCTVVTSIRKNFEQLFKFLNVFILNIPIRIV